MRVFVTGATGFIGSATVKELIQNGHEVLALTRNPSHKFSEKGVQTLTGDLKNFDVLRQGVETSDAVIQLAMSHDFKNFVAACIEERGAIEVLGKAAQGTKKPLLVASGLLGYPKGVVSTEESETNPSPSSPFYERAKVDGVVKDLVSKGVNVQIVRFATTVHGVGDHGLVPMLSDFWKKAGKVLYVDEGQARWPAVHVSDAAEMLRLAIEKGKPGANHHVVAEQGVSIKEIGTVVSKKYNLPIEGKPVDEVAAEMAFLAYTIAGDVPTSSEITRKNLGWDPKGITLIEDMKANYFA